MDIDFHFGTIYVLSRWAGFGSENAKIIAACSQFVDDNYNPNILAFGKSTEIKPSGVFRYSGHKKWENGEIKENNEVWIPFHFLPGLDGDNDGDKLVCKKNKGLADALFKKLSCLDMTNIDNLFVLGIGLHVYADTWAHQEFSGLSDSGNLVTELSVSYSDDSIITDIEQVIAPYAADEFGALGHMSAAHCPDAPCLRWSSKEKFPNCRNNWDEFMEASRMIYKVLQMCNGKTEIIELDQAQEELLLEAFQNITDDDCEKRNAQWIARIQSNDFGFDYLDGTDDDREHDKQLNYSPAFIKDDGKFKIQFNNALNEHYTWVVQKLIENNIDIDAININVESLLDKIGKNTIL